MDKQEELGKILEKLSDRQWRLNHLYHIKDKSGRRVKFNMNFAQQSFYDDMWYLNTILKARQLGFSTFIAIFILDTCIFNSNQKCGIIDASLPDAKKKLAKIRYAYDGLPDALKDAVPLVKENTEELEFSNGSGVVVGTSHRGDTLQILHVSELGKISAQNPEKAREIRTGAINAVAAGEMIFVESTAEGKSGEFYDMCRRAMNDKAMGKELTSMAHKFHFYPWHVDPSYALSDKDTAKITVPEETKTYLSKVKADLTPNQIAWYVAKELTQGDDMRREYPSNPDEAFEGSLEGAFYAKEMALVREHKQIRHVAYNSAHPVYTFWDLGKSADLMVIWFVQFVDGRINIIDYHESNGNGWDFYGDLLNKKQYTYATHVFPHDGGTRQVGKDVRTAKDHAMDAGIRPIFVVPRTKSVWSDIQSICRPVLRQCFFDESKCAKGILHMDNYKKRYDRVNSMWLNDAQHNEASHGADGFRTLAVWYEKHNPDRQETAVAEDEQFVYHGAGWMA